MSKSIQTKTGIGFYTKKPFIVGNISKDDVFKYNSKNDVRAIDNLFHTLRDRVYTNKIGDLNINIYKDGLIVIHIDNLDYNLEQIDNCLLYIKYANIISLILCSATMDYYNKLMMNNEEIKSLINIEVAETNNENSLRFKSENDFVVVNFESSFFNNRNYDFYCWSENKSEFNRNFLIGYEYWNIEEFKDIMKTFEEILSKIISNDELKQILLTLERSLLEYYKANFDVSIILSWSIIERIINILWKKLIDEKFTKRESGNMTDRDYTASIKTRFLKANGCLNENLLEKIDKSRQTRNIIMHGDYNLFEKTFKYKEINFEKWSQNSSASFFTAIELINLCFNMKINVNLSFCI